MSYKEYKPSPYLARYIECYWTSISGKTEFQKPYRVLPDGCMDFIYNFISPSGSKGSYFVGTMTRAILIKGCLGSNLFGVRFHPGGIFPFIQSPLFQFTDAKIEIDLITKDFGSSLWQKLGDAKSIPARIELIEAELSRILKDKYSKKPIISNSVNLILQKRGNLKIEELTCKTRISKRHLEREFKNYVGISPKLLSGIVRFRHISNVMNTLKKQSILDIALENDYYDHPHLTSIFKKFAGITPSEYRKSL